MDTGAFRTPRTIIRPFSIEDAQKAFAWFGNPEVMKFTPSGLQETPCRMGRAKRNPSLPKNLFEIQIVHFRTRPILGVNTQSQISMERR
ncbi:protein of unknown function [Methylocaldum szegediense]|uniref:N-acetyltransferase domain-containing protein n=1 Tax=Methylocaldum szegediense TaxID=73780 RepID=A0ABN8X8C0_9GAMM|nr:protein of unknown function [Methylocaldum szegediense]